MTYKVNESIYYTGDMANKAGWFIITEVEESEWGTLHTLTEINGDRIFKATTSNSIANEYKAGYRFVKGSAYKEYQNQILSKIAKVAQRRRDKMGV